MNLFTKRSIELACKESYLDELFKIYPLKQGNSRTVDSRVWRVVERHYEANNDKEMFRALLRLELFPVKDGYVPYFKHDKTAIDRNQETVNRICGRIRKLGLDELWERCSQPKETNRQMGQLFKRWVDEGGLGMKPVKELLFMSNDDNAILAGTDKSLLEFAIRKLGYGRNKGVDFVARFNGKYVIGEAKFISDEGGHQHRQFDDAIQTIRAKANKGVMCIGILDGVLYIPGDKKCTIR